MGANENGAVWARLKDSPEILRAVLHVYPEPDPYGYLTLYIKGESPLQIELTPTKTRVLIILQKAYAENRGPVERLPVRGKINRAQMAARYKKRAHIIHGIPPETMTSYMGAFQRLLRKVLEVPPDVDFPDLIFVRENHRGARNGVRLRSPIEIIELE
jgi:hypothetical protein